MCSCSIVSFRRAIQVYISWSSFCLKKKYNSLPKSCNDPAQLSNYRIITLQNVYGKLLHKIVAKKLVVCLEAKCILQDNLRSYRPKKITCGNAGTLSDDVYEHAHSNMETVDVILDLDDCLNMLDYAAKTLALEACWVNTWFVSCIEAVLMERTAALKLHDGPHNQHTHVLVFPSDSQYRPHYLTYTIHENMGIYL